MRPLSLPSLLLGLSALISSETTTAQPCTGVISNSSAGAAQSFYLATMSAGYFAVVAGCTTSVVATVGESAPTCAADTGSGLGGMFAALKARWPDPTAKANAGNAGCRFSCDMGALVCTVKSDGLPVELLEFDAE